MNNYRLDKKVEIKAISTTRNALGEKENAFVNFCVRFSELKARKGVERFSSGADQAEKSWTVRVRYDSKTAAIDESMIVVYRSMALRIESIVDEGERHKWIILYCSDHNADYSGDCNGQD